MAWMKRMLQDMWIRVYVAFSKRYEDQFCVCNSEMFCNILSHTRAHVL